MRRPPRVVPGHRRAAAPLLSSLVPLLLSLVVVPHLPRGAAWQLWTDSSTDSAPNPGPRAGHSLLQWNDSVFLFGGRGNEILTVHDPKTYQIGKVNGTLFFETYDQKHFKECFDDNGVGNNDPLSNLTRAQFEECYNILVGTYYNDVWRYDLNCTRYGDGPCVDGGWVQIGENARLGGCRIYNETEVCSHPHERWEHSAAILTMRVDGKPLGWVELEPKVPDGGLDAAGDDDDGTGAGGASGNTTNATAAAAAATNATTNATGGANSNGTAAAGGGTNNGTSPVSPAPRNVTSSSSAGPLVGESYLIVYGGFARMCEDYCSDMWAFPVRSCRANATMCKWTQIATLGRSGPGKRWRAASTHDQEKWVIFGGHRLWQGFAQANSVGNKWNSTERFEYGGYLDDMWVFSLHPQGPRALLYNGTNEGVGHTIQFGRDPGDEESRMPGSASRDLVFGEPVPTALGAWQQVLPRESCFRYPGFAWDERNDILCSIAWPPPRASAALVVTGEFLYLHGGFSASFPYPHVLGRGAGPGTGSLASDSEAPYPSNPYYLSDIWRFDFRSGAWTELHPTGSSLPSGRRGHSVVVAGAALLLVGGYAQNVFLQDLWIYNLTTDRWLEKTYFPHPLYPGNCTSDVYVDPLTGLEEPLIAGDGLPVRSVWGEPTRGMALDGKYGRADYDVFVQQTRRQAPGWDGCRDRADEREDLPPALQYLRPRQRGSHAAIYSEDMGMMLLYGGETLSREELPLLDITHQSAVVGDLWVWSRGSCPKNCSGVGDCWYGHCYCRDGYYGIDCSNATCPGTYCRYDTADHVQICQHCCSAPYNHSDGETYIQNLRKVPCDATHFGLSHGICDGFGRCQCAPPFLTEDCSVRDCPNNCSAHGWCSVEYPVSRCMCEPPWTGDDCSQRLCLNNCSYPNGVCKNGTCQCAGIKSPYNRTIFFDTWHGDDCSWYRPFAGARRVGVEGWGGVGGLLLVAAAVAAAAAGAGAGSAPTAGVPRLNRDGEGEGEG